MIKIGMVSLGCPKNRVDTELMLGKLKDNCIFTKQEEEADVIIINTCGFIESAKQESIDTILEMAEYKKTGQLKGLIVTGCLSERYKEELIRELPEVDAFLGVHAYDKIVEAVFSVMEKQERFIDFCIPSIEPDFQKRVLTTPPYTAYIKISEGCNNCCAYCAIPMIRKGLKSRKIEEIKAEVEALAKKGVSEFVLVAQDTTVYGEDIYQKPMITELLDTLAEISGVVWLRLLYAYPDGITDELLACMKRHDNIVKYIDIPIQHFSNSVLKRMNRKNTKQSTYDAVRRIRNAHPDFIIRTTLIAGFPGESEEDFKELVEGVETLAFDKLGVFPYSQEDGTPAGEMSDQIEEEIKQQRADQIMRIQQNITKKRNEARIGKIYPALIEGKTDTGYYGRTYLDAPDIDGYLAIQTERKLEIGSYYNVRITNAFTYDLLGVVE